MADMNIVTYFIILVLVLRIEAQFFDFFSDLRPFTYQTVKPLQFQDTTTKRTKTNQRYNGDENRPYVGERDRNTQTTREKARRKTTTTTVSYDFYTTQKTRRIKNVTRNEYSNSNSNDNNRNYENNNYDYNNRRQENSNNYDSNNRRQENSNNYDSNNRRPENNNYDYNNKRPEANVIDYATRGYDTTRNSKYTTYNPLYNRPGVKPAVVDSNKPPITNRPATQRPLAVYPHPTDASVIRFPEGDDGSPPVLSGPDVDDMSQARRRRYLQVAEKMCDKYKSLNVKKLEFIPLLPSPESVQINVTECAVSSVPLVVGGRVASVREFPHMALLGWTRIKGGGYSWKCGGSLVSDQYVLTAAHCSFQNRDMDVVSGPPRVVQLGSSYLDDGGALVVRVSSLIRHPNYMQSRSYYDIALVKLVKPVTFSEVVRPACLGVPPPVGEKVVATGWGRTEFGGDQSLELRSVSVPVWDLSDCARVLGVTRKMPRGPDADSQICAGERKGGKDTCQGDSGGPAQIQDGCLWRVVAVTSVGRSCGAANTPAVYAKVFREFIAAQIFEDQSNDINNEDYGSNNQNSGSNNDYGYNNQNSGSNNRDYRDNNQNSGSNNRNNYDNQNVGSSFDNSRPSFSSNTDNKRTNSENDYSNNRQNNNYDSNRQTGNNYDRNQQTNNDNYGSSQHVYNNRQNGNFNNQGQVYSNQESNNRNSNNDYNNHNRQSTTNNYERQNSNRNNNGMIDFNNQNSYSTSKPSTVNYFGSNRQNYNNPRNNYRKREEYRSADDGEDIIYWPEA